MKSEDEDSENNKHEKTGPDAKDYLAMIMAMLETTLLPAVLLIIVLAVLGVLLSLAFLR